jgi:Tol biopolymer transport system component
MTANVFHSCTGKKVVGIPYKGRSFIYSALLRQHLGRMPVFVAISTICAILLSSSFVLQINQGALAGTFPGENGKIAFESDRDGNDEIYVMNADGSGQTRLTDNTAHDRSPSWSPDGEKIAYASYRDNVIPEGLQEIVPEIYIMNADGSGQTRLTDNSVFDKDPSWSPDGTKIAFSSTRTSLSNSDIWVMNADGSGQTRLTDTTVFDNNPSWSPDGTKIAFDGDFPLDIFVVNADGSNVTRLTDNPRADGFPSWSPDGTKIAFASNRDRNDGIYVMNADGSDETNIINNPALEYDPSWSPDGTKIAFTIADPSVGRSDIFVMNADGSGQTNLSNSPSSTENLPDWGPEEDTTPPVITVPDDIVVEATSEQGAEVTYTVTAQDNVDGNATLEEDGSTITQDDIGGDIDISCEPASGSVFPIGDTTVECSATDEAGNEGTASFTVTVNPPPSPLTPAQEAIDELISIIENLDDNVPQDVKASLIAVLNEVLNILNDNNPDNDESVCRTLDAFINQVNANERSDTLTADDADELSTQGEEIRNALDC